MASITDYVAEQGITAEAEYLGEQEEKAQTGYGSTFSYWVRLYRVRLHRGSDATPWTEWSQGEGIKESPDERPDTVLDALISDAWSYINARDFEDFAAEFGLDEDSRKAYAMYEACGKVAEWLQEFLGDDLETVATEYERL